jgi:hypothetical protein
VKIIDDTKLKSFYKNKLQYLQDMDTVASTFLFLGFRELRRGGLELYDLGVLGIEKNLYFEKT